MKKGNFKRFGSGFMAMAMIASSIAGTGMTVDRKKTVQQK